LLTSFGEQIEKTSWLQLLPVPFIQHWGGVPQ